jgi:hypothetical protein
MGKKMHRRIGWFLFALTVAAVTSRSGAEPLTAKQSNELLAVIKPGKEEDRWAIIPWQTDLWQARQLAAKEGKPILLWEMDGHPLGCV